MDWWLSWWYFYSTIKNAEIHGNRFRTISQFSLPFHNFVERAAVAFINIYYGKQPDGNAVHCHLSSRSVVEWVLFFMTLLKSIRFVTLAVTVVVVVFQLKIDTGKTVVTCLMCCCLFFCFLVRPWNYRQHNRDVRVDDSWWLIQWICVDLKLSFSNDVQSTKVQY